MCTKHKLFSEVTGFSGQKAYLQKLSYKDPELLNDPALVLAQQKTFGVFHVCYYKHNCFYLKR